MHCDRRDRGEGVGDVGRKNKAEELGEEGRKEVNEKEVKFQEPCTWNIEERKRVRLLAYKYAARLTDIILSTDHCCFCWIKTKKGKNRLPVASISPSSTLLEEKKKVSTVFSLRHRYGHF